MAEFDIQEIRGERTLWIDSGRLSECIRRAHEHDVDVVGFSRARGYRLDDLEPIKDMRHVRGFHIVTLDGMPSWSLDPLRQVERLATLYLSRSYAIDLSVFPALQVFVGQYSRTLALASCRSLRRVDLWNYPSPDLRGFPSPPALEALGLFQPRIAGVDGVGSAPSLTALQIVRATKLRSLRGVEGTRLRQFDLEICRAIQDFEVLGEVPTLEILRANNCGTIPSLRFIDKLPRLTEFRFVQTRIGDGDLTPLLRLAAVGFFAQRNLSHTPEQMAALGIKID